MNADFTIILNGPGNAAHLHALTAKAKDWLNSFMLGDPVYAFEIDHGHPLLIQAKRAGLTFEELAKANLKPTLCSQCATVAVVPFTASERAAETDGTTHVCHPFLGGCGCGFMMAPPPTGTIKAGPGGTVFTGSGVEVFRLAALISALELEGKGSAFGLKFRGESKLSIAKRTTGLKSNNRAVHIERLKVMLAEAKSQVSYVEDAPKAEVDPTCVLCENGEEIGHEH